MEDHQPRAIGIASKPPAYSRRKIVSPFFKRNDWTFPGSSPELHTFGYIVEAMKVEALATWLRL